MNDHDTRAWLLAWRDEEYDLAYDSAIENLEGKAFGVEEVVQVLRWKLVKLWPKRAEAAFRNANDDQLVRSTTARAFAAPPSLALQTVCSLKGIGPVVGSAVLMAHSPRLFTVMDVRALASLRALSLLPSGDARPSARSWFRIWPDYLDASIHLARELGLDLRAVDQGLWAAKGRMAPPSSAT